ncbi:MAG: hypothetical protein AAGF75_08955, partial [Cyanobacteria bacterium P01_H01_bin.130]
MNKFKFSLGPYEFFASIIGGSPLVLSIYLLLNPSVGLLEIFLWVKNNASLPLAGLLVLISYLLGGCFQSFTWKVFSTLCKRLNHDYNFIGSRISAKNKGLPDTGIQSL